MHRKGRVKLEITSLSQASKHSSNIFFPQNAFLYFFQLQDFHCKLTNANIFGAVLFKYEVRHLT